MLTSQMSPIYINVPTLLVECIFGTQYAATTHTRSEIIMFKIGNRDFINSSIVNGIIVLANLITSTFLPLKFPFKKQFQLHKWKPVLSLCGSSLSFDVNDLNKTHVEK